MIKNMWQEGGGDYQASPWTQKNWAGGAPQQQPGMNYAGGTPGFYNGGGQMQPNYSSAQPVGNDMVGGARPNPWQGKLPGTATATNSDMVPGARPNPNVGINPPKVGDPATNVLSPEIEEMRRRRGMTQGWQQFQNTDNDYRRNQTQYLQTPFRDLTIDEMQKRPMHGGWQAEGGPATSRGSPFKSNFENYRTY